MVKNTPLLLLVAAAALLLFGAASAQAQGSLPPCQPGNSDFLYANWPCQPGSNPLPTTEPFPLPTVEPFPLPTIPPPVPAPFPCPTNPFILGAPLAISSPCRPEPTPPPNPGPWPCWSWSWWCKPDQTRGRYVALGDSVAFGLFSLQSYVVNYQKEAEERLGGSLDTHNMSAPGMTSTMLLSNLQTNSLMRERLQSADYVTWNIGGKDLLIARSLYQNKQCGGPANQECLRHSVNQLKTNWDSIAMNITTLRKRGARVSTMDIYNPFVDEDQKTDSWPNDAGNDFAVLKPYLDEVNTHFREHTPGMHVAPVYVAFNGPSGTTDPATLNLLSFDGTHPNTQGHQRIALLLIGPRPLVAS